MDAVIVDTNVIVIANDTVDDKRKECREHCQKRLKQILFQREKVVVDDKWRILKEYKPYVDLKLKRELAIYL